MATADRVRDLVAPLLADRDLRLYDLELDGGVLRVLVDRAGGADLAAIAEATRAVSRALDEHDPIPGSYTLEVSSPGLERPLRTAEHFATAIGEAVAIKTVPGVEGDRRVEGIVAGTDAGGVTVRTQPDGHDPVDRHIPFADIERARTTFAWGSDADDPAKQRGKGSSKKGHGPGPATQPATQQPPPDQQKRQP